MSKTYNPPIIVSMVHCIGDTLLVRHDSDVTLRDLFAAAVRDSEIEGHFPRIADAASYIGVTVDEYEKAPRVYWHRVVARFKYERADAMLATREVDAE